MSTLQINLENDEAERLALLAKREGATPAQVAEAAVRARLDHDQAAIGDIELGLAELDSGQGVSLDAYEREMDAYMEQLRARRA